MDWEYILSVSPENLSEDEKDELYNTVTWFNFDDEPLDLTKSVALFKVSQEILKYKGEQVEVLVHKLDELATEQGEDEVRRIDSDDGRSSKSKKSGSIQFENLEQKYVELKAKYKKQVKQTDKNKTEISKLKSKVANLDQENKRLRTEVQTLANQDDSRSDISETVKEQHKELISTIHSKNQQISDLLRDIEEVENDNILLREKLTTVRDELSIATNELTNLNEQLNASKTASDYSLEIIEKLKAENEDLRDEIHEITIQKQQFEREMEEFTEEVNLRVDEWKKILDEKEREVNELKLRQAQSSLHSSLSSLPVDKDQSQVSALTRILSEREKQLLDVKTQLQKAIKDMNESTKVIKELTAEKQVKSKKVAELQVVTAEIRKQLDASHERCRDLQENLALAEKLIESRNADIEEILEKLEDEGKVDLSKYLRQIEKLKSQIRIYEKQIVNLVKTSNKLQDTCDQFERENDILREKIEMDEPDFKLTSGITPKQKKYEDELFLLKRKIGIIEERKLQLKLDNHNLNKMVQSLTNQLTDSVKKPEIWTSSKLQSSQDLEEDQKDAKEQIKSLAEANDALKLALHNILGSTEGSKELKCDLIEGISKVLDRECISGWNHPATRIQADVQILENIISSIREKSQEPKVGRQEKSSEELDIVAVEESKQSEVTETTGASGRSETIDVNNICDNLRIFFSKMGILAENSNPQHKASIQQLLTDTALLDAAYKRNISELQAKLSDYKDKLKQFEELNEINAEKLALLHGELSEESLLAKSIELSENNVKLKRKVTYLQCESIMFSEQISDQRKNLSIKEVCSTRKINELFRKNQNITTELEVLRNKLQLSVAYEEFEKMRKNFDLETMNYRKLMRDFDEINKGKEFEIHLLKETRELLQKEKAELNIKIQELLDKLLKCESTNSDVNDSIACLTKQLSESEVIAIGERQRANHTNNLYELVKEQLQKSEERLGQLEQFNNEILQKNLLLQEQLKDVENQVTSHVDPAEYKDLQNRYNDLLQTNEKLSSDLGEIKDELKELENNLKNEIVWSADKERDLLALKHQIVDLLADSDEKMQIATLGTSLNNSQVQLSECKERIEVLNKELLDSVQQREEVSSELEKKLAKSLEQEERSKKKLRYF